MRHECYRGIVGAIVARPARLGATRLVAVDGRSGSGKSTTARALAEMAVGMGSSTVVVHTDDVLSGWEHPLATAERLRRWVLDPIASGGSARYHPYDWIAMRRSIDVIEFDPPDILIMDGVGSARSEFVPLLSYSIFIYVDIKAAFDRVLARDGDDVHDHLIRWQSEEDEYFAVDDPGSRADVVL